MPDFTSLTSVFAARKHVSKIFCNLRGAREINVTQISISIMQWIFQSEKNQKKNGIGEFLRNVRNLIRKCSWFLPSSLLLASYSDVSGKNGGGHFCHENAAKSKYEIMVNNYYYSECSKRHRADAYVKSIFIILLKILHRYFGKAST